MAASTPYQYTDTLTQQNTLVSVTTVASTTTAPFGFSTKAQADAIVTAVNALIVLSQLKGDSAVS